MTEASNMTADVVDIGQSCLTCGDRCPGYAPQDWKKICANCKCPRMGHEVFIKGSLAVKDRVPVELPDAMRMLDAAKSRYIPDKYLWAPVGFPREKIEDYFKTIPEEKRPIKSGPGEVYWHQQLIQQFPPQDFQLSQCRFIDQEHIKTFEEFVATRNDHCLDRGYVRDSLPDTSTCRQCKGVIYKGSVVAVAPKCGETAYFHPGCFVCDTCKELLCELVYCIGPPTDENSGSKLFCERHFAEQVKPRCGACDEMIFSGEYTRAMNRDWHASHFCCTDCVQPLTGKRYVLRDKNPICLKCYEGSYANQCTGCQRPIGIEGRDLAYKDRHWHEACFLCNLCKMSLVDKAFGTKEEKIYCGNCYDSSFGQKCDGCTEIFRAGTKKLEYKGRQWHEKCFVCVCCKHAIGTGSFVPKENEIYCGKCYEEKFALRCSKCALIITANGITYKNSPFHKECFLCTNCNTQLAGQKFTVKDERPFCAACYAELFAKRCSACRLPIIGQSGGSTKFVSFENRHWHNECFECSQCQQSLVGKGFITDEDNIICPDCAKTKF
ncbi:Four and a half LIM domains protein 2 [Hypsibius exemplaris]|uniref:Four and a half LIM domains protein 2 n=1 Tax=Hypsibius exemplaris TaxID=2072580 RepID=A0A1W0WAD1_HYPEX|nr:Four and a half LIM domains protein 2 [Hypsibius exemplaris]